LPRVYIRWFRYTTKREEFLPLWKKILIYSFLLSIFSCYKKNLRHETCEILNFILILDRFCKTETHKKIISKWFKLMKMIQLEVSLMRKFEKYSKNEQQVLEIRSSKFFIWQRFSSFFILYIFDFNAQKKKIFENRRMTEHLQSPHLSLFVVILHFV
jgi:hypothetical protein